MLVVLAKLFGEHAEAAEMGAGLVNEHSICPACLLQSWAGGVTHILHVMYMACMAQHLYQAVYGTTSGPSHVCMAS